MVPQTTSHALFERTTVCLNTSFESCSPLVNDSPRSARTHAMLLLLQIYFFCISLGSAVTFLRWSEQICSQLVSSFLRSLRAKNYWNRFIFDRVIPKIKRVTFLGHSACNIWFFGSSVKYPAMGADHPLLPEWHDDQQWQEDAQLSRPPWKEWLVIYKPAASGSCLACDDCQPLSQLLTD